MFFFMRAQYTRADRAAAGSGGHWFDFARPPDGLRSPSARCAKLASLSEPLRGAELDLK